MDARGAQLRAVRAVIGGLCVLVCLTLAAAAQARRGVPSPKPSAQAISDQLEQSTGLVPSQVTGRNVCAQAGGGQAQCAAQELVLRQSHQRVRPHTGGRNTFTQVFPSRHRGIAPQPGGADLFGQAVPSVSVAAAGVTPPQSGTPAWLQQAYDLTYLSQTRGSGVTVGIVDAYDDPNAESDLAYYRSLYGLPPCTTANGCFRKVNQNGGTSYPAGSLGWEEEMSLDLDAVSALCPNCHILLVEASSAYTNDMNAAVARAVTMGASVVSNSWSANTTYPLGGTYTFAGVPILAATGDHGYIPQTAGAGADAYPAAFPGVTAVGGTTLAGAQSARGFGESAWSLTSSGWGASSGCALGQTKPSYQKDLGCSGRAYSDLSADADPNTGLIVYDRNNGGLLQMGGTSLATPLVAAYEAITGNLSSAASPGWAYGVSSAFNDPLSGSSGSTCSSSYLYICNAGAGYDGPTGVGSVSGGLVQGAPGIGAAPYGSTGGYKQTVSSGGAMLTGGVYPNGLDTSYYWQYGTSTSYGQQTQPVAIGSGQAAVPLTSTLSGLIPGTTYNYRLVAANSAGISYGYNYTFQTASQPPASQTPPAITGTAQQGLALSASVGTWSPAAASYSYQWQRSTDGGTWTNISGATSATYTPGTADLGDYLRVTVTGSNPGGSASATSAIVGPVASGAPRNTVAPAISGTPQRGQVLNVASSWDPAGTSYTYQWQRSTDGATWQSISGATSSSYTVAVADEGSSVRAVVTAGNPYGQASASSAPVGPVSASPPVNSGAPVVAGTTQRTFQMNATWGSWSGAGNIYSYQWQRSADGSSWQNIAGATTSVYTLAQADEGALIRMLITASNVDGVVTLSSAATVAPVSPAPPANVAPPTVSGVAERTYALSANKGTWTGPDNTYSYQWQRDFGEGFVDIAGATSASYTLAAADEGAAVRVVVAASNPDGTIAEASQATTTVLDAVPVNQSPPTISGAAERDSTLTASPGLWDGLFNTYAYQWQRSSNGSTWTDVADQTGSSYTIGPADEGSALRVQVTATDSDGSTSVASQPTAAIPSAPPLNTTRPAISGTATRGMTLTSMQGAWAGIGNAYAYRWQRSTDGSTWTNISGATSGSYTLQVADEGATVRLLVTASNPDATVAAASQPTAPVQASRPANSAAPSIGGAAQRGSTLSSDPGAWTGIGNTYAYQWQRSSNGSTWTNISGATDTSYPLGVGDEHTQVRLLITATNADGTLAVPTQPTATIPSAPPLNTAAPTIAGSAKRSSTLTASPGTWSGIDNSYTYQWQRSSGGNSWTSIAGATGATYTVQVADENNVLRVVVTGANVDGPASATSAPTGTVPSAPPVNTAPPVVSGDAVRSSLLSASQGTWDGDGDGNGYSYQWQRSSNGSAWQSISGATGTSYILAVADENSYVRVTVTAANPDGTAVTSSAPTAPVQASPPTNTDAPAISGSAQRSSTLTSTRGTWGGAGNSYAYQWQRDSGAGVVNVSGATPSSYTPGPADEGATVRLLVTAGNADGTLAIASDPTDTIPSSPPTNSGAPTISGLGQRSSTLTSAPGIWAGIGNSHAYQWQRSPDWRSWTNIQGATASTYTLAVADEGNAVRLLITATNPDDSLAVASAPTGMVEAVPPTNTAPPTISGDAQRGTTLTSAQGAWGGAGNSYAYRWQRSADGATWTNISGATAATYTLQTADEGDIVRLLIAASNPDGTLAVASASTQTVTGQPPVGTDPPTVSGAPQRSSTLTGDRGNWAGLGNTYTTQWQHSSDGTHWTTISGATGATYTLTLADENTQIRLLVSAANVDGTFAVASDPTAPIQAAPPVNTAVPAIAGTPQRSFTLTAGPGTWSGAGNTYGYQWQRSTDSGWSWTNIAGATGSTYALPSADEYANVRVVVTATNVDGTVSTPSPPTPAVQPAPPQNTGAPALSGRTRLGSTLRVDPGAWTPGDVTLAYRWQRGSAAGGYQNISGATAATYTLQEADVGQSIRVIVTGSNTDGTVTAATQPSATVAQPPQSLTAPAAPMGTLQDSYVLTAGSGTWDSADASFDYTWLRCPSNATAVSPSCSTVGSGGNQYQLTTADIGYTMAVSVTASTSAGGSSSPVSSAPTAVVVGQPLTNTVRPSISGTPQVAHNLTANPGSWSVALSSISYAWQRCDADGSSGCSQVGTGPSYTLSFADNGHTIALVVGATSPGRTATARSLPLTIQYEPLPQATAPPVISGTAARASLLSVSAGQWANNPTALRYQWQRCDSTGNACHDISGAGDPSYLLSMADERYTITVKVTATNTTGTGVASAQPTAVVAPVPPVASHAPVVQGAPQQGGVVTAAQDAWQTTADTGFSRVWQRCASDGSACQNIPGATGSSYRPLAADVGATLKVLVSAANVDGTVTSASAPSAVVFIAAPRWRALPVLWAPNAKVGTALSIKPGTWTGPQVGSDSVEAMRCTSSCVPVGSTAGYTLSNADLGALLRLRETASNAGGSTLVWSAQYIGPVVSADAGATMLSATGTAVVKTTSGEPLASAKMQASGGALSASARAVRKAPLRKVIVQRKPKAKGVLQAWVCPATIERASGPMPACTRKVKLSASSHAKKTIGLPAGMTGKVRIVVVRSAG